ncbi:MAG: ABC transporter ATP-binding protein [Wenzhouxiangellaceae bacterium]
MSNQLRLNNISLGYPGHRIITAMSDVYNNGLYLIRGANGCGKSTLLAALAGLHPIDSGQLEWNGKALKPDQLYFRRLMAHVADKPAFYPQLQGRQLLDFVASARGNSQKQRQRGEQIIDHLGAIDYRGHRLEEMSLGTMKKFFLAAALMGQPSLLLLDEPFSALDQAARLALAHELQQIADSTIILLAEHSDLISGQPVDLARWRATPLNAD